MIQKFKDLWEQRDKADFDEREKYQDRMIEVLRQYVWENYPNLDDEQKIITVKRDFESELPPNIMAEALECDIALIRRFRHTRDRGVIDTYGNAERRSIPPSKREKIMARDNHSCVACPARAGEYTLQLHHIIPKAHGGLDEDSNLAMLCEECHLDAHCGDFNSKRLAYNDKEEFWRRFAE